MNMCVYTRTCDQMNMCVYTRTCDRKLCQSWGLRTHFLLRQRFSCSSFLLVAFFLCQHCSFCQFCLELN